MLSLGFLPLDTFIKTLVSFGWSFIPSFSAALILLPHALTSLHGPAWSCRLLGASPWCHAGCRRGRHRDCRTLLVHVRSLCYLDGELAKAGLRQVFLRTSLMKEWLRKINLPLEQLPCLPTLTRASWVVQCPGNKRGVELVVHFQLFNPSPRLGGTQSLSQRLWRSLQCQGLVCC